VQRVGHIVAELSVARNTGFEYAGLLSSTIQPGSTIYLYERVTREYPVVVDVPYEREVRMVRTLPAGETQVSREGTVGELTTIIQVAYVRGVEVAREVKSINQTRAPINKIILEGENLQIVSGDGPRRPGDIMSLDGMVNDYAYIYSMIMESTGYSARQPELSNYTFSGHRAVRGIVAVDPRVIPLGTWLYVEGYGRALASDTGGAIIGNIIDLCFDTVAEAIQHGRRNVRVWILRDQFEMPPVRSR
jgi:3D (Asp-Asp-Asp) domain-containing protein